MKLGIKSTKKAGFEKKKQIWDFNGNWGRGLGKRGGATLPLPPQGFFLGTELGIMVFL